MLQIKAAADVTEVNDDPSISGTAKPLRETSATIIEARDLTLVRTSHEGEEQRILDSVNIEIHAGEVIGIAGTSGGAEHPSRHHFCSDTGFGRWSG